MFVVMLMQQRSFIAFSRYVISAMQFNSSRN